MGGRIEAWMFGAIVGGLVALLILVLVLVIGITLLRRYLHNKQRKRRHYSQHVEDGTAAGNQSSLSRVTFGVLWKLQPPAGSGYNQSSSSTHNEVAKPHAFAITTESKTISLPSSSFHTKTDCGTIKTASTSPASSGDLVQLKFTNSQDVSKSSGASTEAVYYELENPTSEVKLLQLPSIDEDLTKLRHHSSNSYTSISNNSYTSISSDIHKLPPPPTVFPSHRRGRRYSLPNNLLLPVTHNTTAQQPVSTVASSNHDYINYRYGRRNSEPSVSVVLPRQPSLTPGVVSPAEYEKPLSSYMSLDLSNVIHHSYTSLHLSNDPNTPSEPLAFPRQQLSMRTRHLLHMNSIPEENSYEKLNPLPKPSL